MEDDELPQWKRPKPQIDLSSIDPNDPEAMLKMTKKGQSLMMFATVSGKINGNYGELKLVTCSCAIAQLHNQLTDFEVEIEAFWHFTVF